MSIVSTSYGQVSGAANGSITVYKGIPFAAPPVGDLRWNAPQPPASWAGVRDGAAYGPSAMQPVTPGATGIGITTIPGEMSEDCLYLNIWTPATSGKRPVMVWIHGGAFVVGSGSQALYEGAPLAARGDVVVVTVNYRMGAFGFLPGKSLFGEAFPGTGNEGILDQIAALRWVRDEIANFGGDPDNVTIFGESAGSISISAILGAPSARGLFHKAILQSGSANIVYPKERGDRMARQFHEAAGSPSFEALQAMSAEELLAKQNAMTAQLGAPGKPQSFGEAASWAPIVDGDVVPVSPFDTVADGAHAGVPIVIGTTADEMKLFLAANPEFWQLKEADLEAWVGAWTPGRASAVADAYRSARTARGAATTPAEIYAAVATDGAFRAGAMRLAEDQAAHAPVYAYLFTWKAAMLNGMLGACHAIDLPFALGNYAIPGMDLFTGTGEGVAKLAGDVMDAWAAFARTGDPNHAGLPEWPRFDAARKATMHLGADYRVEDAPMAAELTCWAD